MTNVISVRFRGGCKTYYFDPRELTVQDGDDVIVETNQGHEFVHCTQGNHPVADSMVVQPLRPVLRLATENDRRTAQLCRQKEKDAFRICQKKIAEHKLEMKLVRVECNFDSSKILFFFTADGRVDFRELVKDLASVFRARIELRQIGVRDEAKMLGGLGICGRPFCCSQFMEDFVPVSIKMAKTQSLSLNPTKISGTCGRLMCCLKYEQAAYEEAARKYNLAQQIQYDEKGEQALAKLSIDTADAVDTLIRSPETGTSAMSTGLTRDRKRSEATQTLERAGYTQQEISDLVNWRQRQIDREKYQKAVENREKLAKGGFLGAAAATLLSVPETLASGVGVADLAMQNAMNSGTDRPANYYSAAMRPYAKANTARSTISQKLEQNTDAEIFGQNIAAGAYNIGTSMLDSTAVAGLAALGVPPLAATSLLGGSAATSAMVDAKDRGVSDEQAVLTGLAAGVAESLFEEVSLEKLLKLKFGKFRTIVGVYTFFLFMTFAVSAVAMLNNSFAKQWILMSAGGLLFAFSDAVLSTMYFKEGGNTKANIIINHVSYYAAQFIIASSVLFIK